MPAEASLKRVVIQKLIYALLEDSPLDNSSSSNHESQPAVLLEKHENGDGIEVVSGRTSPGKPWNSLHTQSSQVMDIGLLDMSFHSSNVSSLGMRDLLECQHFGQGSSFHQPGCPTPSIKEEVPDVDHDTSSNLGHTNFESINGLAAGDCHIGYTPGDYEGLQWNFGFSDQGTHPEDTSVHSSDDSEEVMIMEHEPEVEGPEPGNNEHLSSDEQKENLDSLTESYVSASSDVMETPPEDSQELVKVYGHNGQVDSSTPKLEEVKEMPAHQEFKEIEDEVNVHINKVVEDSTSDSDEEHAAKRIRLTPLGNGETELIGSLSKEVQV